MLHDNNNILLITDYEEIAKLVLEKLILLRDNDRITACNSQKIKKTLENSLCCIVILHENSENPNVTIKLISTIKEVIELLSEKVDLFTDKATEHDINAYIELKEFDNKDAFLEADKVALSTITVQLRAFKFSINF